MMAAPRFCTVVMNSPCSQSVSVMTSVARLPPIRALAKSGNWVAEWLPQMATLVTSADRDAGLAGQLGLGPVLVEPGHGEPAVGGHLGGVGAGDQAVGVAGVARPRGRARPRRRARRWPGPGA